MRSCLRSEVTHDYKKIYKLTQSLLKNKKKNELDISSIVEDIPKAAETSVCKSNTHLAGLFLYITMSDLNNFVLVK